MKIRAGQTDAESPKEDGKLEKVAAEKGGRREAEAKV